MGEEARERAEDGDAAIVGRQLRDFIFGGSPESPSHSVWWCRVGRNVFPTSDVTPAPGGSPIDAGMLIFKTHTGSSQQGLQRAQLLYGPCGPTTTYWILRGEKLAGGALAS